MSTPCLEEVHDTMRLTGSIATPLIVPIVTTALLVALVAGCSGERGAVPQPRSEPSPTVTLTEPAGGPTRTP